MCQTLAKDQGDNRVVYGKACDCSRCQVHNERRVAEMREARDDHVLRIARDSRGAADIARGRNAEQQWNWIYISCGGSLDYERRQRDTDDVVDEERGE